MMLIMKIEGESFMMLDLANDFLDMTSKAYKTRGKIGKLALLLSIKGYYQ